MKHAQFDVRNVADLKGHATIQGADYENLDLTSLLKSFATTGLQASNLAKAIDICTIMRREEATIFFGFTSNMVSSGVREAITYLAKHQHVHVMVTTTGSVDEDLIKCFADFKLGDFDVKGEVLFDHGINRIGNIFVPNDRFAHLDKFVRGVLQHIHREYTEKGRTVTTRVLARELGLAIGEQGKTSFLYWAAKNEIPVIVPAPMDGSLGDLIHFFRQQHPDFHVDVSEDLDFMVKTALNAERVGTLLAGAGVVKHYVLNANIFREGVDYAVYVNTSAGFDGSDSGGSIEEAITWGKVKPRQPVVKVQCDASIAFPLIIAGSFAKK